MNANLLLYKEMGGDLEQSFNFIESKLNLLWETFCII
jgi:hypothetical protein